MKIQNDYIHLEPIGEIKGKPAWAIVNNKSGADIACICWYPSWKRYTMVTDTPAVFDIGCMVSIIQVIKSLGEQ